MIKTIRIHDNDNVIIALEAAAVESLVSDPVVGEFTTVTAIPLYHKIATVDIPKGTVVLKYGSSIGIATEDIPRGAHVHIHNLDSVDAMVEHVEGGK